MVMCCSVSEEYFFLEGGKVISLLPPCCSPAGKEFSVFSYGTSSSISGKTMEQIKSLNSCTSASALTAGTEKSLSLSSVKSKAVSWLRSVSPETGIPYFWVLTSWGLLGGLCRAFVGRWQLPSCRVMWHIPVNWSLVTGSDYDHVRD